MKGLEIILDIDRLEIYQVIDYDKPLAVKTGTAEGDLSDTVTNRSQSIHQEVQLNLFETMGL
ncbi:hypothetical protein [Streptococcus sobrinus]|uniref:hypothetical protein n=1 Tax=Streptococcus sobrinus TaxID=1310 RepID=UPI00031460D4|nr:hypothetical protein [Streptococcus sobrinus]